jgi:hypothetical protein
MRAAAPATLTITRQHIPYARFSPGFLPRSDSGFKLGNDPIRNGFKDIRHVDSPLIVICGLIE